MRQIAILFLCAATAIASTTYVTPHTAFGDSEHQVGPGDTVSSLAQAYGVSASAIIEANHIANPDFILVGQVLRIPAGSSSPAGPTPDAALAAEDSYEIQPGDSLSAIAERFSVTQADLVATNRLSDPDLIIIGQFLKIPRPAPHPQVPSTPEIEALFDQFAAEQGLDPGLVRAVAWAESSWRQSAVSPAGAVGIMQITPATAEWLQTELFGYPLNLDTSAHDNIRAGVRLLRFLLDTTGNIDAALAAYYQGLGSVTAGILYNETVKYVQDVHTIKSWFWP